MIWYLTIATVFISVSSENEVQKLPCNFLDSVNITGGILQPNGSIEFGGVLYPKEQYAVIDYDQRNETVNVALQPYTRGCVCNIKTCVRLCCPYGSYWDFDIKPGRYCRQSNASLQTEVEIIDENNQTKLVELTKEFGYVDDQSCPRYRVPELINITYSGQILNDDKLWSHHEYCLNFEPYEDTNETLLEVLICEAHHERFGYLAYAMLSSVPFIIATFMVYICIPELRNLHGKCLLFYLFYLLIGYLLVAWMELTTNKIEQITCYAIGYTVYFSYLSAFLWLNVISFDIWWNFRTTKIYTKFSERKRFLFYMLYVFSVASLLVLIVYVVDSSESVPHHLQPGIGTKICYLKNEVLSQFLYFYQPLAVICIINMTFFIVTALKIRRIQHDLQKLTSKEESCRHQSNLNKDKDNFVMFLRLFIVMGVTWIMESVSGVFDPEGSFFLLTDLLNSIQGVIIFILFVMKRRVLSLIKKRFRYCNCISSDNEQQRSDATNNSTVSNKSDNFKMSQK